MKVTVQVKTNSKVEGVAQGEDGVIIVRVNTPPIEGKANERVRVLLAQYYNVPKSRVNLLGGHKSRKKIFEIE